MSATGRSSPRCAHKRSKTMASCFLRTLFVRTESETMKYMGEFECCWRHDWAMCVFLCRLMSVSETQLFLGPEELEYPTLLKFPAPKLQAYSKESVVAEKFEAMIKLGMANSRMKDFYDLWVLAQRFEFQSTALAAAIQATFDTRRTSLPVSVPLALPPDFFDLPNKQTQWRAFLRKSGLKADSSLKEIVRVIELFVMPTLKGISKKDTDEKVWQGGPWKKRGKV
jgi:Nucleotidyl transferase AbiEii toxin, Type IV TA system